MPDDVKNALTLMYSSQFLDIVDQRDELTRGDLQGAIEAIVRTLIGGDHSAMYKKLLTSTMYEKLLTTSD